MATTKTYKTVKVEKEEGITWVILNRPEKRNAMNPQLHYDMLDAVTELETEQFLDDKTYRPGFGAYNRKKG
jgi:enoyl-CoA hydratase/carnithine racemase